jgi:A/G-specific adenine glycosylase
VKPIAQPLLAWFDKNGRHNLPWQSHPANIYWVWLSEIMLQQTQVNTVKPYFYKFIETFPTINLLAQGSEDRVLKLWAGLGYYARARNLHKTACLIVCQYQGKFPTDFEEVLALPGIGKSTAGAILSLSFNQKHPILDGNVKRILARYHQITGHYSQSNTLKSLWELAQQHTPDYRNNAYTQAIMDLGATLCTRHNPQCKHCPLQTHCLSNQNQTQAQYPQPKPKKTKPTRITAMLIFSNKTGEIHLEKRPSQGIWGGLWSFPECENNPNTIRKTIKKFDTNAKQLTQLDKIKHSFTHYHLEIYPILILSNLTKQEFYTANTLALPAPIQRILTELKSHLPQ